MPPKESKFLKFLYKNFFGRIILFIFTRKFITKIAGWYMNSGLSRHKIKKFIQKNNIDMSLYEDQNYSSFNDFFTRTIKKDARPIATGENILISPCDAKLSVYEVNSQQVYEIKGSKYTVKDLINQDLPDFENGYFLIFRLSVDDYHHYAYIDEGYQEDNTYIKGVFHTVQSIALEHTDVFHRNSREYTILHTKNFGDVIQIEVGAMCVGKINNFSANNSFQKGQEKGMFEFGGSTIILLFQKDKIILDEKYILNTKEGLETQVQLGQEIGKKCSDNI